LWSTPRTQKGMECGMILITEEADAQRCPLSYEDLSRLLFADRKTIGHYIKELEACGTPVVTRSTYTDASAKVSHFSSVFQLFLMNYSETEIAKYLHHTLGQVEAYIKDFLRICIAHRQGYTLEGVRHLTSLSKRVVQKHLDLYTELSASPAWNESLERKLRFFEASLNTARVKKGVLA
jgi:hypothetical protein